MHENIKNATRVAFSVFVCLLQLVCLQLCAWNGRFLASLDACETSGVIPSEYFASERSLQVFDSIRKLVPLLL